MIKHTNLSILLIIIFFANTGKMCAVSADQSIYLTPRETEYAKAIINEKELSAKLPKSARLGINIGMFNVLKNVSACEKNLEKLFTHLQQAKDEKDPIKFVDYVKIIEHYKLPEQLIKGGAKKYAPERFNNVLEKLSWRKLKKQHDDPLFVTCTAALDEENLIVVGDSSGHLQIVNDEEAESTVARCSKLKRWKAHE